MATTDESRGSGVSARSSRATTDTDGAERLSVEVSDDLAVSVHTGAKGDAADDADLEEDDETIHLEDDDDTSGFAAHAVNPDDDPPSDAPLGLTSVRLPARGRRRGRPGTIF